SMPMRDNFLAAKKVAMALHSLISLQFPRDYLGIVGFSEVAREIRPQDLPEVSWDFVYGTNMQHGFQISRRLPAGGRGPGRAAPGSYTVPPGGSRPPTSSGAWSSRSSRTHRSGRRSTPPCA